MTLARVNGLRTIWVEAAVPEAQAGILEVGRRVEANFAAYPGQRFEGKVAAVLPEANMQTRTLRVRMEFPNPGMRLKPGMFGQVHIEGPQQQALVVPSEAVIRTGKRAVVFVAQQSGRFVPVDVEIGAETNGKLVVLRGLEAGQQVAVSGQFLIDSEASLRGMTERMAASGATAAAQATPVMHEGEGTITQLSDESVTLSHGPIPSMQWGSMTMPFKLGNPQSASGLKAGDRVRFRFHQHGGDFVIESIVKAGADK
jgi:Cu(I)/Ag(I) efflux system membrane fusion protein